MSIKVDQDVLYDYCKAYHDSSMDRCEGSQCEAIEEMYLDEHGITEDPLSVKTFAKLSVGDWFYMLDCEGVTPGIKRLLVNSISLINDDPLNVHYQSTCFNIARDKMDANEDGKHFLYKKDCGKALREVCIKRILELSKIIGQISA